MRTPPICYKTPDCVTRTICSVWLGYVPRPVPNYRVEDRTHEEEKPYVRAKRAPRPKIRTREVIAMPVAPAAAEFKTICQYARRGWGYKQIAGALKLSVEYVAAVLA